MNQNSSASPIQYRPGTQADTYAVFTVFYHSLSDLYVRLGLATRADVEEPDRFSRWWADWQSLFEHLGRTAEQFWIAERDGQAVGYARTILRDQVRELTDFFVLPGEQSAGLGGELLQRAFREGGAEHRTILATVDARALARYMKAGIYPLSPVITFSRDPQIREYETDLVAFPMDTGAAVESWLDDLDRQVLGYHRPIEHAWLRNDRQGFFYLRDGRPAGYAYLGKWSGPAAVLDSADWPAVLAHLETQAHQQAMDGFWLDVPLVNRGVVDTLLQRGFKIGDFLVFLMSERTFGKLENYIVSSPDFFL